MEKQLPAEIKLLMQIAEMQRIYSTIQTALIKLKPSCVVITSAARGEGKTVMVAGLAAIAAQQDKKRILALDLNWHSPALHTYFGLVLNDVQKFTSGVSISEIVQKTAIKNLDLLPAIQSGPNEKELYEDKNSLLSEIIKQARNAYDCIFIDTSSIFPTNRRMMDPVDISKTADAVALVVLANVTPRQQAKRARTTLETAGANILGVIVNQWQNPLV